jgi:hypothetical protein
MSLEGNVWSMSAGAKPQRSPRSYRDYVRFTAKTPANIALAIIYAAVAIALFSFGHPVWGGAVIAGGVLIWLRPAYYVASKLRRRG